MTMRPPVPPFTEETARQKVQAAEDAWNTREPERVAGAYSEDSQWRNRDEFLNGRAEIYDSEARSLPVLPAVLHGDAPVIGAALATVTIGR